MKVELKKVFKSSLLQCLMIIFIVGTALHGFLYTNSQVFHSLTSTYAKIDQDYHDKTLTNNVDLDLYVQQFQDPQLIKPIIHEKISYDTYLKNSEDQLNKKLNSSIFSSKKDQKRLKYELEEIHYNRSIQVKFVNDSFFLNVLKTGGIYYLFILVFSFIASYYLIIVDQDTGLLQLYQTTKSGGKKLFLQKIGSVVLSIGFLFILKIGLQLFFLWIHGFPFSIPIQMISTYTVYLGKLSAIQYFVLSNILNFFLVLTILLIFLLIYQLIRNVIISFVLVGLGILIEFLMHQLISVISVWKSFKIINIFYILDMGNNDYFQYSSKSVFSLLMILIFLCVLVFTIYSLLYINNLSFHKKEFIHKQFKFKKLISFQILDNYHFKKYIFVLLILISYLAYDYINYNVIKRPDVTTFTTIQNEYLGKIDTHLLAKLEERNEKYIILNKRYNILTEHFDTLNKKELEEFRKVNKEIQTWPYFQRVYNEVHAAYDNGATYYVDNQGVKLWLQETSAWYQGVLFFMIAIPMILFVCTLGNHLYHTEISTIMLTTKKKSKYFRNTITLLLFNNFILLFLVYLGRYFKFNKYYQVNLFGGKINQYLYIPFDISYSFYLFLYFLQYYLVLLMISLLILKESKYFTYFQSILFGVVITMILYFIPFGFHYFLQPDYFKNINYVISIPILIISNLTMLSLFFKKDQ